ncbi:MAG TPA: aspartate--tRNA ligase [Thermotogota bacterium]|nr:aspartate--tRNA ligase [Thermotogota bacterium]
MLKRTHTCGELTAKNAGEKIILNGWVDHRRDLGGIIFTTLRDRYGTTQIVFDPEKAELIEKAKALSGEDVIAVSGTVMSRPEDAVNKRQATGEIEVDVDELEILSKSETPPIYINIESDTSEEMRLKYRYLDLRTKRMQRNLMMRSKIVKSIRDYFEAEQFVDIETPVLSKSSPEGARDYLVPSRIKPGSFYALPQSPQLYKQLLMVSGYDRYYQIVKCFRDEDLRADRQPEFTQVDYEMSFVTEEDVIDCTERMLKKVFKDALDYDVQLPLPRIEYDEAMDKYGSDKPDTRFEMLMQDITGCFEGTSFEVVSDIIAAEGVVKAIVVEGAATAYSRKVMKEIEDFAKIYGAKGLMNIKVKDDEVKASFAKAVEPEVIEKIKAQLELKEEDLALIIAGDRRTVNISLGALRLEIARRENLMDKSKYNLLWVTRFPMFEYSEEEDRYVAQHHPFTMPLKEDLEKYGEEEPHKIKALAYDVVLNGWELGGGSIRIHDTTIQERVFDLLKIDRVTQKEKFGYLLEAFKYGVPPHGGCALGLDRMVSLMLGENNIRDVIAFPKTTSATCLMTSAPSSVDDAQLHDLNIRIEKSQKSS